MVTRPQIEKLSARIEALVAAADGDGHLAYVWRYAEENEDEALARHYKARPQDRHAKQKPSAPMRSPHPKRKRLPRAGDA